MSLLQKALRQFGYQLVRNTRPVPSTGTWASPDAGIPASLAARLAADNPRLRELADRYARCPLPMFQHTWWTRDYIDRAVDLRNFRGDNAWVWQTRHMAEALRQRYYLYACDVAKRDALGLFDRLDEDGAFGCWVQRYHRFPALSRDQLDSVNELNFLERHMGLARRPGLSVLDIGAGYGRLAHRSVQAFANLEGYCCVDTVPESTFVCEVYLEHRHCGPKAGVVPGDELGTLEGRRFDLAVNVHSFSEMSLAAIEGWLDLLARLGVPRLFVVPNDAEAFLTIEADGKRRDFSGAIAARGYRPVAREPAIADADTRELVGVLDHLFLFERA